MKNILLGIIFILTSLAVASQRKIDVIDYDYLITINDKSDTITGRAAVYFKVLDNTDTIELDLAGINSEGRGMSVSRITESSSRPWYNYDFIQAKDKLKVLLSLKQGQKFSIVINYKGIPADGLIISKNKFGKRTFFSDNWPNRAHQWIPCIDDPADKASVQFSVITPLHYKVVSNGTLIDKDTADNIMVTAWREDIPLPTKVMAIGVADFAVDNIDTVKRIPVSSWVYRENRTDGFKDYSIAPAILSFMMDYVAPFPYKKLANVQSKTIFGGMENAGAIFYDENTVDGLRNDERLIAHEIAHQWFGDMATEKSFAHLWLSEGFATYLAHIYIESKYGTDSLEADMKKDRQQIIAFARTNRQPVVDSVSDYMELLNPNSYEKGGWILHMLRRDLGDTVFHQVIRKYYETYAGKNAATKDFQKIAEEVSGKDLSVFFKQWLYTPGLPQLDIKWKLKDNGQAVEFTVTQKQQQLFSLPLEVATALDRRMSAIQTFNISKREETFTMPFVLRPNSFIADPRVSLLADIKISRE